MKLSPPQALLTILAAHTTLSLPIVKAQNHASSFSWQPTEINDNAYISVNQLKLFYQLEETNRSEKLISLENRKFKLSFTLNQQKCAINKVHFYLSDPVKKHDGMIHISQRDLSSLLDPVLRPSHIANTKPVNTVILDAGHGGQDQGAKGLESALTLAIVKKTRAQLENKGYRVVLTRDSDSDISLADRLQTINREKNAILISLHFNAGKADAHGMETYVVSARKQHPAAASSVALATAVHSRCLMRMNNPHNNKHNFQTLDRGIRHAKFRLLVESPHPTILIEAGFLTHLEEAKKISEDDYQDSLANSITQGIRVYQKSITQQK